MWSCGLLVYSCKRNYIIYYTFVSWKLNIEISSVIWRMKILKKRKIVTLSFSRFLLTILKLLFVYLFFLLCRITSSYYVRYVAFLFPHTFREHVSKSHDGRIDAQRALWRISNTDKSSNLISFIPFKLKNFIFNFKRVYHASFAPRARCNFPADPRAEDTLGWYTRNLRMVDK